MTSSGHFDGVLGGGQVFQRRPDRLEQSDLVVEPTPRPVSARQVEQIAGDIVGYDQAGSQRLGEVAGLAQGPLAGIDEDAGAGDDLIIGFPHLRREAADEIDMDAFRQPLASDQRFAGQGGAGHDIGAAHRPFQVGGGGDLQAAPVKHAGQPVGFGDIAPPDQYFLDRPDGGVRQDQVGGEGTRPHHQQPAGIAPRQIPMPPEPKPRPCV